MVTQTDIADYYNQTFNHYQTWWRLDRAMAVHYGLKDASTHGFIDELMNTNRVMAEMIHLKPKMHVFDAGCGVGGSLFYLVDHYAATGVGYSLSKKQIHFAQNKAKKLCLSQNLDFRVGDFCNTAFADQSFDVVWALESLSHLKEKKDFAGEAYRLLKPGGRLVVACYHRTRKKDVGRIIKKWQQTWSLASIATTDEYLKVMKESGFNLLEIRDYTQAAMPTARRMFWASVLGMLPSELYNLTHRTSRFARSHYRSGFYQYRALKKGLWQYKLMSFEKPAV